MHRSNNMKNEKSKDFVGSMKTLFKSLNNWRYLMVVSIVLAALSSVLALIAPNKLSDFTNIITDGIKPNTEVLTTISEEMFKNMNADINMLQSNDISMKDIPLEALSMKLKNIEIDGVKISPEDQMVYLNLASKMKNIENTNEAMNLINELPDSIYSLVKPKIDMDKIKSIALLLVALYLISASFSYLQSFIMATISNNYARNLRNKITKKINKLPLRYFDEHENGDILSRVTNDVDTIAQNLNQSLASLVSSLTLFLGSVIMMFITNWIMAITSILASFIGFGLMFAILGRSQKYFSQKQRSLGALNGYIEEMYSGHHVVKAYNGTEEAKNEFNKLNNDLFEANIKSQFLSGLMPPIMGFVGNLGYVAVCIVGALLVSKGTITFGVIVAFMIYVRLFTTPLSQIAQAATSLQSTAAASERVFDFLDSSEMSDESNLKGSLEKSDVKGFIEFKNVKFGYDESRMIINDFSVKVKPGEKVAIVGPTGAGKTTIVNLLMKFYEINEGDILIDGVSIKDLTRENIHDLFCMVLQDTWLFEGSIKDNLKFNNVEIDDKKVMESCKVVGVDHFVKTLPGGLDANVGGDSDTISSGQKQLFTIARGMIKNSPFLILDEATSNVDTRTEELVQKAMDKLTKGKTSFIIAHRLSTIKNADIILVMKDGNIIEQGNHEKLMKKKGFYADLYNSQFKKETREVKEA